MLVNQHVMQNEEQVDDKIKRKLDAITYTILIVNFYRRYGVKCMCRCTKRDMRRATGINLFTWLQAANNYYMLINALKRVVTRTLCVEIWD